MKRDLKLYIPVVYERVTLQGTGMTQKRVVSNKTTMVGAHNCPLLRSHLPSANDIFAHMVAQRERLNKKLPFTSIKISVTSTLYKQLISELSHKLGLTYVAPVINLVAELGQLPIIQIEGNKAETFNFKRTVPRVFKRSVPVEAEA